MAWKWDFECDFRKTHRLRNKITVILIGEWMQNVMITYHICDRILVIRIKPNLVDTAIIQV